MNNVNRILVTGGVGYVGSVFVRDALAAGYKVICLDMLIYDQQLSIANARNPAFSFVKGDIRNSKDVKPLLKDVDAIVHLAAIVGDIPCHSAPGTASEINEYGTEILCDLAREQGVQRFVFASTCSCYGIVDQNIYASESSELNPQSLYAENKIKGETVVLSLLNNDLVPTCVRFATAYGQSPRTRFDLLLNSLAYEAWSEKRIEVYSTNTWRPYIHVADMSRVLLSILQADPIKVGGEIFNGGFNNQNFTKRDLIDRFVALLPQLDVIQIDATTDHRDYRVNFDKLKLTLNVEPKYSIEDGFMELVQSFEQGVLTSRAYELSTIVRLREFFTNFENENPLKNLQ